MLASGVIYANELNAAYAEFGVAPGVLRAILDYLGADTFPLPEEAVSYAQARLRRSSDTTGTITDASNNYLAMAWYLTRVRAMYGGHWTPVVIYFGGGPVAEQKATEVARRYYPKYERSWR